MDAEMRIQNVKALQMGDRKNVRAKEYSSSEPRTGE
jgi:hypothetical protein